MSYILVEGNMFQFTWKNGPGRGVGGVLVGEDEVAVRAIPEGGEGFHVFLII